MELSTSSQEQAIQDKKNQALRRQWAKLQETVRNLPVTQQQDILKKFLDQIDQSDFDDSVRRELNESFQAIKNRAKESFDLRKKQSPLHNIEIVIAIIAFILVAILFLFLIRQMPKT
jgi:uncharacterized Zn finger protein